MRVVEDKNYTIDLRPYFIDLRQNLVMSQKSEPVLSREEPAAPAIAKKEKRQKKQRGFLREAVSYATYAVIFVLLVWGTPRALTRLLNSDYPIASITSSSMWPELKRGDIVFIEGIKDKSDIKIGDIVVYDNSKGFTIHRVVKLKTDTFITRGDANNVDDAPVSYDQVVGRAVTWQGKTIKVPWAGRLSHTVQNIKGAIINTVQAEK